MSRNTARPSAVRKPKRFCLAMPSDSSTAVGAQLSSAPVSTSVSGSSCRLPRSSGFSIAIVVRKVPTSAMVASWRAGSVINFTRSPHDTLHAVERPGGSEEVASGRWAVASTLSQNHRPPTTDHRPLASPMPRDPHRDQPILLGGAPLTEASGALVLLHGRGGSAQEMLALARDLQASSPAGLAW